MPTYKKHCLTFPESKVRARLELNKPLIIKKLLFCILILNIFCTYGQKIEYKTYEKGINIGHIDTINSKVLNESRELLIYLPESISYSEYKRVKYPVLYLLDGRYNFLELVALQRQYAEKNDTKILPEMIIVGISNKNHNKRGYDYSPTPAGNSERYGGGDHFLKFIKNELFTYIENRYPAASKNRTFIGHSFGGVAVLNALSRHSDMFENYVLIDASIWFDNELFLNDPEFTLKGKNLSDKNLFIGIANTSKYGSTLESIKNDTISANRYIRHSLELKNQVNESSTGPNLEWQYYENDTHGSSMFLTQLDALRFFYSWFEFKEEKKYQGKYDLPKAEEESFSSLTEKHFKMVSDKLGYDFYPTVPWLISNSDMLLNFHKVPEQAKDLLYLAKEYYPENKQIKDKLLQLK
ncbi:alpha/beta hydrolase [Salegentibacter sp. T436]|uniref:alpha/beta hydrolase n=1 Tax=Salegentibacter sp. T436 TaxID=1729720 RepID=UPI0009FB599B|nr:alpha/beta hydrolase-fold protein [Salegentibacter sp. T436]